MYLHDVSEHLYTKCVSTYQLFISKMMSFVVVVERRETSQYKVSPCKRHFQLIKCK